MVANSSPTLEYLARRERVLGRRLTVAEDEDAAAEQVAEHFGGRALGIAWLVRVLEALDRLPGR